MVNKKNSVLCGYFLHYQILNKDNFYGKHFKTIIELSAADFSRHFAAFNNIRSGSKAKFPNGNESW